MRKIKKFNQRVKANAQLGEDGLNPRKSFVEEELHLATIPFVGRCANNWLLIHWECHLFTCLGSSVLRVIGTSNPQFWSWVKSYNSSLFEQKIWNALNNTEVLLSIFEKEFESNCSSEIFELEKGVYKTPSNSTSTLRESSILNGIALIFLMFQ